MCQLATRPEVRHSERCVGGNWIMRLHDGTSYFARHRTIKLGTECVAIPGVQGVCKWVVHMSVSLSLSVMHCISRSEPSVTGQRH